MTAILNFQIFKKIAKHKNAYISKTVLDRAISTKFWPTGYLCRLNFCLTKNGCHFEFSNFSQKLQNTKMLIFRKPCKIEQFRQNFWPTGCLCIVATPILKIILCRQKWQPFWIFCKIAKHENAYISKTMCDRAISTKLFIHRVTLEII